MTSTTLLRSDRFGTLAYREAGREHMGTGQPVVFVHGVGMQSAAWQPQIDSLGLNRHVIALDMPGHGQSDCLAAGTPLEGYVAWLMDALDTLGLDRVNLVGHSMGALIAGGFAVCHPERLERVALLNGVFCREDTARDAVIARSDQILTGTFDTETPLRRWFSNTATEQDARERVAEWLSQVRIDGYATAYSAFARGDATYAAGFADIPCPLLALTGDGDQNSTPAMSEAMAKAAPLGRAVIIKGHRHMVNLTAPETVTAALEDWLRTPLKERNVA